MPCCAPFLLYGPALCRGIEFNSPSADKESSKAEDWQGIRFQLGLRFASR